MSTRPSKSSPRPHTPWLEAIYVLTETEETVHLFDKTEYEYLCGVTGHKIRQSDQTIVRTQRAPELRQPPENLCETCRERLEQRYEG
jgi:hypothetical protein